MTCDHVRALNLAKEGQWDEAHQIVQPYSDKKSCLIHGYLHRVEGDLGNAGIADIGLEQAGIFGREIEGGDRRHGP